MAAYRRVYDSRHLQADCQKPGSAQNPRLGSRVWATFTFTFTSSVNTHRNIVKCKNVRLNTSRMMSQRIRTINKIATNLKCLFSVDVKPDYLQ